MMKLMELGYVIICSVAYLIDYPVATAEIGLFQIPPKDNR